MTEDMLGKMGGRPSRKKIARGDTGLVRILEWPDKVGLLSERKIMGNLPESFDRYRAEMLKRLQQDLDEDITAQNLQSALLALNPDDKRVSTYSGLLLEALFKRTRTVHLDLSGVEEPDLFFGVNRIHNLVVENYKGENILGASGQYDSIVMKGCETELGPYLGAGTEGYNYEQYKRDKKRTITIIDSKIELNQVMAGTLICLDSEMNLDYGEASIDTIAAFIDCGIEPEEYGDTPELIWKNKGRKGYQGQGHYDFATGKLARERHDELPGWKLNTTIRKIEAMRDMTLQEVQIAASRIAKQYRKRNE